MKQINKNLNKIFFTLFIAALSTINLSLNTMSIDYTEMCELLNQNNLTNIFNNYTEREYKEYLSNLERNATNVGGQTQNIRQILMKIKNTVKKQLNTYVEIKKDVKKKIKNFILYISKIILSSNEITNEEKLESINFFLPFAVHNCLVDMNWNRKVYNKKLNFTAFERHENNDDVDPVKFTAFIDSLSVDELTEKINNYMSKNKFFFKENKLIQWLASIYIEHVKEKFRENIDNQPSLNESLNNYLIYLDKKDIIIMQNLESKILLPYIADLFERIENTNRNKLILHSYKKMFSILSSELGYKNDLRKIEYYEKISDLLEIYKLIIEQN